MIHVRCMFCHKIAGSFDPWFVPKSLVCQHCKTGQVRVSVQHVGPTYGRNYPEGFFS